jgi:hypothetical protein
MNTSALLHRKVAINALMPLFPLTVEEAGDSSFLHRAWTAKGKGRDTDYG